ncbi:MAG TPA: O-antigen ligase family protein [bacterium]|nr:O-antigen ligase family protein [bacterium]
MYLSKLLKINKYLLCIVPFLPLFYIDGFFFPFVFIRTILFRIIILLCLSIWVYILLNYKFKIKLSVLSKLLLIFLGILFITSFLGLDFYKSFFSTFERMEGLIYWIFLVIYFFIIKISYVDKRDWIKMLKLFSFASFFVFLYGIIQRFAIINVFKAGYGRMESTLGNAAFLGSYALLMFGISLFVFFYEKNKNRHIYLSFAICNLISIILSLTRSSWIGLIITLLFFLIFLLSTKEYRKIGLKILLISIILVSILAVLIFFTNNNVFYNLKNRFNVNDPVISNRLLVWQNTLNYSKNHILFGVGLENFSSVYNTFYTPDITEEWFDKTHNQFLDILVTSGVFGLFSYLGILLFVFLSFLKNKKENIGYILLGALIMGYCVNNFFVFDTLNTAFLIIILIAFSEFLHYKPDTQFIKRNNYKILKFNWIIYFIYSILFLISFYYLIYRPFFINRNLFIGVNEVLSNKTKSYNAFNKIVDYKFASNEASKQVLDSYKLLVLKNASPENQVKFFKLSEKYLTNSTKNYPLDIRVHMFLSQLIIESYSDNDNFKKAEELLTYSIKYSPKRPQIYYLLAQTYIKLGEENKAIELVKELVNQLPNYADPKFILSSILLRQGDVELANQYFNEAINMNYIKDEYNYKRILDFLLESKRYEEAIPYYLELIKSAPENYDYRVDLSKLYYLKGNFDLAMEEINTVQAKNPEIILKNQDYVNLLLENYNKK